MGESSETRQPGLSEEQALLARQAPPDGAMEKFKLARAYIEHENTLVNQRTTWYITFQGFLFAALFVSIRFFEKNSFSTCAPESPFIAFGVILICVLGIISSFLLFAMQGVAYDQIKHVEKWWEATGLRDYFPVITGRVQIRHSKFFRIAASKSAGAIVLVWLVFIFTIVAAAYRTSCGA